MLHRRSVAAAAVVAAAAAGCVAIALSTDDGHAQQRAAAHVIPSYARLTSVLGWPSADLTSTAKPFRDQWVDLATGDGLLNPWRMVVYRSVDDALCMAVAPLGQRAKQIVCGSPYTTAEELLAAPITTVKATRVAGRTDASMIVVSGLAAPHVRSIRVLEGADRAAKIDGPTLRFPFTSELALHSTRGPPEVAAEIRPFIISARDPGTLRLAIGIVTQDGRRYSYPVRASRG